MTETEVSSVWDEAIAAARRVGGTIASGEEYNEYHGLIVSVIEEMEAAKSASTLATRANANADFRAEWKACDAELLKKDQRAANFWFLSGRYGGLATADELAATRERPADDADTLSPEQDAAFDSFLSNDPDVQSVLRDKGIEAEAQRVWYEICAETASGGDRTSRDIIATALRAAREPGQPIKDSLVGASDSRFTIVGQAERGGDLFVLLEDAEGQYVFTQRMDDADAWAVFSECMVGSITARDVAAFVENTQDAKTALRGHNPELSLDSPASSPDSDLVHPVRDDAVDEDKKLEDKNSG